MVPDRFRLVGLKDGAPYVFRTFADKTEAAAYRERNTPVLTGVDTARIQERVDDLWLDAEE